MTYKLFLDMDGVFVNFVDPFLDVFGLTRNDVPVSWDNVSAVESTLGYKPWGSEESVWEWIEKKKPDVYFDMPPCEDGMKLIRDINRMSRIDLYICTTPPSPAAAEQKMRWIKKHLQGEVPLEKVILIRDKHLLATDGSILIDDSDINVERFIAHGGVGVRFPQKWNKAHDHVQDRCSYLGAKIIRIVGWLDKAARLSDGASNV